MYRERMKGYYPQVIQSILEFQSIIDGEYPEIESLSGGATKIIDDTYLTTMSEDRIKQWEKVLGILPSDSSSTSERRDIIIARIRGQGKLNTETINKIVNAFTGGTANSWVANSTLYVEITPPPENKQYRFEDVEQEIARKIPAHLGFSIERNYITWGEVKNKYGTWQRVKDDLGTWNEVLLVTPS
jgi:hypothetical protein